MQALNIHVADPAFIPTPRNCPRCGKDWQAPGMERVCLGCRNPEVRERNPPTRNLSPREKQIVALILQAKSNKAIAWELHLTEGTIKEYLNRIYRKLEVKNRTDLAIWALTRQEAVA